LTCKAPLKRITSEASNPRLISAHALTPFPSLLTQRGELNHPGKSLLLKGLKTKSPRMRAFA